MEASEKEDLNRYNSIEEIGKEDNMAKTSKKKSPKPKKKISGYKKAKKGISKLRKSRP